MNELHTSGTLSGSKGKGGWERRAMGGELGLSMGSVSPFLFLTQQYSSSLSSYCLSFASNSNLTTSFQSSVVSFASQP